MALTEKELAELAPLIKKHPIVGRLYDELEAYQTDPTRKFYNSIANVINTLSNEMNWLCEENEENEGKVKLLNSNDKKFANLKVMLTDSEKIFAGLNKGLSYINPEEAKRKELIEKGGKKPREIPSKDKNI